MGNSLSKSVLILSLSAAGLLFVQMVMNAGFILFRWDALRSWFDMCNSWFIQWGMPFMAILLDALVWTTVLAGVTMLGIQLTSYLRVKRKFATLRRSSHTPPSVITSAAAPISPEIMMPGARS